MNDNYDDPYAAPKPERFEPNVLRPESEPIAPASAYAPTPVDSLAPPMLATDPMPPIEPLAVPTAPDPRMALDGTSLWLNRLGEELVAWLKTVPSVAIPMLQRTCISPDFSFSNAEARMKSSVVPSTASALYPA